MECIEIKGRHVFPITTLHGQQEYYDYMNYCRSCIHNTNPRIIPTEVDTNEYLKLKEENPSMLGSLSGRKKYKQLQAYENNYDWRPKKSGETHYFGMVSPAGQQLLPNIFEDVFTQIDVLKDRPNFIPVSNGDGWALVSLGTAPVLMTEFRYNAIIPERWERRIFFVQDKETMKWGALRTIWQSPNSKPRDNHTVVTIEPLMPCIAEDIYEDQLLTDCEPTLFFITRIGDKIGIMTDFGYSDITFDYFEADDFNCTFRLIRNDRKRARRADWWHPDGKDLLINLKRRKSKPAKMKLTSPD